MKQKTQFKRQKKNDYAGIGTVVLFLIGVLFPVFIVMSPISLQPKTADAAVLTDFGGFLTGYAPAIVAGFVIVCPAHITVRSVPMAGPPLFGLYVPPGPVFRYLYSYLFTGANLLFIPPSLPPNAAMLGKKGPVPWPTCTVPYPVYPLSFITGTYFIGTSKLPAH